MKRPHVERLPGGSYSVRVSDPTRPGHRIRLTGESEAEVLARAERVRAAARELSWGAIGPSDARRLVARQRYGAASAKELWELYAKTQRGQWGRKLEGLWRCRFGPYFERSAAWELTPEQLAEWERRERAKGISPKTLVVAWQTLRAAYRAAIPDRIQEIPWRGWRPEGPPRGDDHVTREACTSMAELEALVRAAIAHDERVARRGQYADLATRIVVAALCGLRQGEIAGLGWDCVLLDDDPPTLRVWWAMAPRWRLDHPEWSRPQDPPKGRKRRTQVLHGHAARALELHRERLKALGWYRPDGPVFPGIAGAWRDRPEPIPGRTFRRIVEAAGLPNVEKWSAHSLRHSFATLEVFSAWSSTGDVRGAMSRTGHSSIQILETYLHRAGRGRPAPFIPALSGDSMPPALPAGKGPRAIEAAAGRALGALASASVVVRPARQTAATLREIAEQCAQETPKIVTDRADARYSRAYKLAQRAGASAEACRQAGGAARRGFLASWARIQAAARRRLAELEAREKASSAEAVSLEQSSA